MPLFNGSTVSAEWRSRRLLRVGRGKINGVLCLKLTGEIYSLNEMSDKDFKKPALTRVFLRASVCVLLSFGCACFSTDGAGTTAGMASCVLYVFTYCVAPEIAVSLMTFYYFFGVSGHDLFFALLFLALSCYCSASTESLRHR